MVDGHDVVNFCSNDYLGLAHHPELMEAGIEATRRWGTGSGASHLVCGHSEMHDQLEHELAEFVGAERALLFSTGYMANLAIPQTFLRRNDLLLQDKLNHASMIDAGRANTLGSFRYRHVHVESVNVLLNSIHKKREGRGHDRQGRIMLMTDGVFSMDGDIAPLKELLLVCNSYDVMLVVDDAHGFGVLGANGGGTLQQLQIPIEGNLMMVGTLGKAAGSFGAFVAGDRVLIENLIQFGRTYIYTTALPTATAAVTLAALRVFRNEPERRQRLFDNVSLFRECASQAGLNLADSLTPIQPVFLSQASRAEKENGTTEIVAASQKLFEQGYWVAAIRPPTVPAGTERLRITIGSEHTHEEIEGLVAALSASGL